MSSREYTRDEMGDMFMDHVRACVEFWSGDLKEQHTTRERLSGLAHSILVAIDGCSGGLPAFALVPQPHPDDMACHQSEGVNWYPSCPELPNDISGGLHERLYTGGWK